MGHLSIPSRCIDYVVSNPATFAVLEGLQVLQLRVPFRKALLSICALSDDGAMMVVTTNIARISIAHVRPDRSLTIDNVAVTGYR